MNRKPRKCLMTTMALRKYWRASFALDANGLLRVIKALLVMYKHGMRISYSYRIPDGPYPMLQHPRPFPAWLGSFLAVENFPCPAP
jgi:hypothetical protein